MESAIQRTMFKNGDLVNLKSGGPQMTVVAATANNVDVVWFDGKKLKTARFPPMLLKSTETRKAKEDFVDVTKLSDEDFRMAQLGKYLNTKETNE